MMRLPIPDPAPLLHPLRDLSTAATAIQEFPGGRLRITIDHQPLNGVTPEMLLWWFSHIGGPMPYAGTMLPRYRVWHPLDHIHWALEREAPGGGAAEGARFRIVEAMGRDERFYVDSVDRVEKLDRTGVRLVLRIAGATFFQLEHTWSQGRGRTHYVSVLDLGSRFWIGRPINAYLRSKVFVDGMAEAWLKHNIEEVGLLEHFLPELHLSQTGGGPRSLGQERPDLVEVERLGGGELEIDG
jgi:hypothetical protein